MTTQSLTTPISIHSFSIIGSKGHRNDQSVHGRNKGNFVQLENRTYVIKETTSAREIFVEYVGGNLAKIILQEDSMNFLFTQDPGYIFMAAEMMPNFITGYAFNKMNNLPYMCWPYGCIKHQNNTQIVSNASQVNEKFPLIQNMELVSVFMYLISYSDYHFNNVGLKAVGDGVYNATLVDFDQSFADDYRVTPSKSNPQEQNFRDNRYQDYIRFYDRAKLISAIEKIESINFLEIIDSLFIDLSMIFTKEEPLLEMIKSEIIEKINTRLNTLITDKQILQFSTDMPNASEFEINQLLESSANSSRAAEFFLCQFYQASQNFSCNPPKLSYFECLQTKLQIGEATTYNDIDTLAKLSLLYNSCDY